jgi:uncharacterized protein with HEPN domain
MADVDRLEHILELIDDVHRYANVQTGRAPYDQNELVRTWVRHKILLIGEASDHVSEEIRARYPDVPWRVIKGMRNRLVHGYDQVDDDIVWTTVVESLPDLRVQIDAALAQERLREERSQRNGPSRHE